MRGTVGAPAPLRRRPLPPVVQAWAQRGGGWGGHLVRQWCVCPSQAAPLTPGGAQGGWRQLPA